MIKHKLTYAELFAGCGGLSLGIEAAGFSRLFANELSDYAAQTYAYNLIFRHKPPSVDVESWYTRICSRKRNGIRWENDPRAYFDDPLDHQFLNGLKNLTGQLFVGSITQLNRGFKLALERQELDPSVMSLDLLAGGPPCQSFSFAGLRQKGNPRNKLSFEFLNLAKLIKPKIVLLENVSGILHAFEDDNEKWYAWHDIAKSFYDIEYIPICTLSMASQYGVPQKRPRFIMVAVRDDLACKATRILGGVTNSKNNDWASTIMALEKSRKHFSSLCHGSKSTHKQFQWIESDEEWPNMLIPQNEKYIFIENAIDSLSETSSGLDLDYEEKLRDEFCSIAPSCQTLCNSEDEIKNKEHRRHTLKVKSRFRLLRLLACKKRQPVYNRDLKNLSDMELKWLKTQELIFPYDSINSLRKPENISEICDLIKCLDSKKHSQRSLIKGTIAPAQLSIPDDLVHYSADRVLSVREMARIQSFPDWFEFKGKVTTGGKQRAYEVPRYTQVGNAVPPLMAKQIGIGLKKFLELIGG